jgi:chromosome segregation ATPase
MNPESQLTMTQAERDAFNKDAATLSTMVSRLEADCAALRTQLADTKRDLDILRRADFNLGHDRWLPALKQAEQKRTEAQTHAEAAERERDHLRVTLNTVEEKLKEALRDRDAWQDSHAKATAVIIKAKDRLEEERDRLRVALKEATERAEAAERNAIAAMAPTTSGRDAQAWTEEIAALNTQVAELQQLNRAYETDATDSRAKLDALSAFIRGGVSALVRG